MQKLPSYGPVTVHSNTYAQAQFAFLWICTQLTEETESTTISDLQRSLHLYAYDIMTSKSNKRPITELGIPDDNVHNCFHAMGDAGAWLRSGESFNAFINAL